MLFIHLKPFIIEKLLINVYFFFTLTDVFEIILLKMAAILEFIPKMIND